MGGTNVSVGESTSRVEQPPMATPSESVATAAVAFAFPFKRVSGGTLGNGVSFAMAVAYRISP